MKVLKLHQTLHIEIFTDKQKLEILKYEWRFQVNKIETVFIEFFNELMKWESTKLYWTNQCNWEFDTVKSNDYALW